MYFLIGGLSRSSRHEPGSWRDDQALWGDEPNASDGLGPISRLGEGLDRVIHPYLGIEIAQTIEIPEQQDLVSDIWTRQRGTIRRVENPLSYKGLKLFLELQIEGSESSVEDRTPRVGEVIL